MQYKAIRALSAVAHHGTYTAAAEALNCSKAYISEQISWLEKHYGVQLVHRTTRKVSLTPAGLVFVQRCDEAFAEIADAEDLLQNEQAQLKGRIRIASIGGIMGEEYIAPLVVAFMQQHPQLNIELDFSSQNVNLLSGEYDLAIRFGKLADSSLVARNLCQFRSLLIASTDYLNHKGTPQTIEALNQHRLIFGTHSRWTFHRPSKTVEISPTNYLRCGNGRVMRESALQGLGIAFLPDFYIKHQLATGDLVSLLPEWTQDNSECNIIYPPGRYRLTRIQKLVDFLIEGTQQQFRA